MLIGKRKKRILKNLNLKFVEEPEYLIKGGVKPYVATQPDLLDELYFGNADIWLLGAYNKMVNIKSNIIGIVQFNNKVRYG